jgi:hypothetical protein
MKRDAVKVGVLVVLLALGAVAQKAKDRCETPIDKSDPFWEFNNNLNENGVQYHKVEATKGCWKWVVDEDAMKWKRERREHQDSLYYALRTRVLTKAEMKEVDSMGWWITVHEMQSYNELEKRREFDDAMLQQFRLRREAARERGGGGKR